MQASAIVVGSGSVGPDASADSRPSGTSVTPSVIFIATDAATAKSLTCRIHLQFLFSGTPVGEVGVHVVKNGFWQETFGAPGNPAFPPAARGQALVLRATVTAKGYGTARAGWSIVAR